MIKAVRELILTLFVRRVPEGQKASSAGWDLLPYSFDVDWFRVNGEDYLTRINVPGRGVIPPFSSALTDLVSETSSNEEVPVVATTRPPCILCRSPSGGAQHAWGDSEKLHRHIR